MPSLAWTAAQRQGATASGGQQQPVFDFALGARAGTGQPHFGPGGPAHRGGLAGAATAIGWPCWRRLVERGRFRGQLLSEAANWIGTGQTPEALPGRDRRHLLQAPVKDVCWSIPCRPDFPEGLVSIKRFTRERTLAPGPQPSRSVGGYYPGLRDAFGATGAASPGIGRPSGPQQFQQRQAAFQRRSEQTQPQEFARASGRKPERPAQSSGPYLAAGQNPGSH